MIQTINPATGKLLQTYPLMNFEQVDQIIGLTQQAYLRWKETDFSQRQTLFLRLRELLLSKKDAYAKLVTDEMGKPITQAKAEIEKCALLCEFYANNAEQFLAPVEVKTNHQKSYICFEPLGIVFSIMPWNFPVWQVMRFMVPNLMAGNATVLRHADCCTGTALLIEQIVREAGFPENLFRTLVIDHALAAKVIEHPAIIGVTLTGSERAGSVVASTAGKALKRSVLELGGSDPYLILADADIQLAAEKCVSTRLAVSGQVCISPKRLIVVKEILESFTEQALKVAKTYQFSDPQHPQCQLGPMARQDLRATLHKQIQDSIQAGAKCLLGGELPTQDGFYYPATVLTNVKPGMPAYSDELFGPVITIIAAQDEQDAIRIANDVRFGLGSGIFTRDLKNAQRIAQKLIQAGTCNVNSTVASDPRLPFGGIKSSGYGRELSEVGIKEFVNIKTICLD